MAEEQKTGCSPSDCAGCSHAGECGSKPQSLIKPENKKSHINHVIAVVSGKGGVGKSMVTASLARLMREQGFSVGIMDADITGPSIPKMYGIHEKAKGDGENIFPCEAKDGTGDVPLTVFQSLPVEGIVIVTSPQDLVRMIVKKAYNMAGQMDIPVLGIVENYSYLECPDCGRKISVFGESHIDEVAEELGVPVIGKMPIDASLAEAVENENFAEVSNDYLAEAVNKL